MIIEIHTDGTVGIREPDDFRRFDAVLAGDMPPADGLRGKIEPDGTSHVWVLESWLRDTLGTASNGQRAAGLDAMIRYAASKGWVRDTPRAIRAHIAAPKA